MSANAALSEMCVPSARHIADFFFDLLFLYSCY